MKGDLIFRRGLVWSLGKYKSRNHGKITCLSKEVPIARLLSDTVYYAIKQTYLALITVTTVSRIDLKLDLYELDWLGTG